MGNTLKVNSEWHSRNWLHFVPYVSLWGCLRDCFQHPLLILQNCRSTGLLTASRSFLWDKPAKAAGAVRLTWTLERWSQQPVCLPCNVQGFSHPSAYCRMKNWRSLRTPLVVPFLHDIGSIDEGPLEDLFILFSGMVPREVFWHAPLHEPFPGRLVFPVCRNCSSQCLQNKDQNPIMKCSAP